MVPVFDRTLHDRLNEIAISPAAMEALQAQRNKLAAIEVPANIDARSREAAERAIAQSFVAGFRWIMVVSAALAIAGAASAWILMRNISSPAGSSTGT